MNEVLPNISFGIKCLKCGAICAVGLINPKTQLCTDCDEEYEPAEWWWMDWKLKEKE